MNIVLYEPEIPQNTGNIGRTCVVSGTTLHLIRPLGFDISDKEVKRSGMDYWKYVDLHLYDNFEQFLRMNGNAVLYMASKKALNLYTDVEYAKDCFIMFGSESKGIPEEILISCKERCIRIPMIEEVEEKRVPSLNLSNSVAIVLYEALRQHNFSGLLTKGELKFNKWLSSKSFTYGTRLSTAIPDFAAPRI